MVWQFVSSWSGWFALVLKVLRVCWARKVLRVPNVVILQFVLGVLGFGVVVRLSGERVGEIGDER